MKITIDTIGSIKFIPESDKDVFNLGLISTNTKHCGISFNSKDGKMYGLTLTDDELVRMLIKGV